jgi:hypothetical protein
MLNKPYVDSSDAFTRNDIDAFTRNDNGLTCDTNSVEKC